MELSRVLRSTRAGVACAVIGTALLTAGLSPVRQQVGLLNEGLLLLVLTLLISATWGRGVGLFAAVLTNLTLNFFFVEPLHRFAVEELQNVIALIVFLVVSVVGSSLLSTAREAVAHARRRQQQTEVLLGLSRALIGQTDPQEALEALCSQVVVAFRAPGASVLAGQGADSLVLAHAGAASAGRLPNAEERAMAERALLSGSLQGFGYLGLDKGRRRRIVPPRSWSGRTAERGASVAIVPLKIGERTLGVLRLDGPVAETPFRDQGVELLMAFAGEAALAVQRLELAHAAARAEALKQADEMKNALMASISHELKTPLATIKTSVSSLLDAAVAWSEEDKSAFLETIDAQTDRLNGVISDILDLTRIESGAVRPILRPVLVAHLFEEATERASSVTAGRRVSASAPEALRVKADGSLMVHALGNLVENAAKYSRPDGAIRLSAKAEGEEVELAVEDEGPGVPAQDLPHVFEPFFRSAEQSRRIKGSGLGLALVRSFVALCGGTVAAESSTAATRFVIRLPAADGRSSPT